MYTPPHDTRLDYAHLVNHTSASNSSDDAFLQSAGTSSSSSSSSDYIINIDRNAGAIFNLFTRDVNQQFTTRDRSKEGAFLFGVTCNAFTLLERAQASKSPEFKPNSSTSNFVAAYFKLLEPHLSQISFQAPELPDTHKAKLQTLVGIYISSLDQSNHKVPHNKIKYLLENGIDPSLIEYAKEADRNRCLKYATVAYSILYILIILIFSTILLASQR